MNLKRLLEKGYFPKELPPPFETTQFAAKARFVSEKWISHLEKVQISGGTETKTSAKHRFDEYLSNYTSSKCMTYSLAKGIYSRRKLGVPNPLQYYNLSKLIVENWKMIRKNYNISDLSASTPVELNAVRAVRTKSTSLNNFKFLLIEKSFNKRYELRLDISQFYPSIYTHAIPWAFLGKKDAKKYHASRNRKSPTGSHLLTSDPKAATYAIGDRIDTFVRNCQEKHSIGLPIGPDTSFILAEVIGHRIDLEIKSKIKDIEYEGIRYYDDYYFYTNTFNDAERILKKVQQVLNEFNLETNESKVRIKGLPIVFDTPWVNDLNLFRFKTRNKYELRNFFALVSKLVEEYPKDSGWIISYALGRFEYDNVRVEKNDWPIFLNLLIHTLTIDPSNIDQFLKILLSYREFLTKITYQKISEVLHTLIKEHLTLNHSFEVSWALWILRTFKIKCESELLNLVLASEDYFSGLICLDIIYNKLYKGSAPKLTRIESGLSPEDFVSEKWMFTYESIVKGWLKPKARLIDSNDYFKILSELNVSFYNAGNQIKTEFTIKPYHASVPKAEIIGSLDFPDIFGDIIDPDQLLFPDEENDEDGKDQQSKVIPKGKY